MNKCSLHSWEMQIKTTLRCHSLTCHTGKKNLKNSILFCRVVGTQALSHIADGKKIGTILLGCHFTTSKVTTFVFTFWPSDPTSRNFSRRYISSNMKICNTEACFNCDWKYWKHPKCPLISCWISYGIIHPHNGHSFI